MKKPISTSGETNKRRSGARASILVLGLWSMGIVPAEAAFIDNGSHPGIVLDSATGLFWQKSDDNVTRTIQNGSLYVTTLNVDNLGCTWRLPNISELQSIVDYSRTTPPSIDTTAFPGTDSARYWSNTPEGMSNNYQVVDFTNGQTKNSSGTSLLYVRAVADSCPQINVYYCDGDGDGHYSAQAAGTCVGAGCQPQGCVTTRGGDCNDANPKISPAAYEVCGDSTDNDCDGLVDDVDTKVWWYQDNDQDQYGNPSVANYSANCNSPLNGYVANSGDCDDTNGAIKPGAAETCNQIDDNCDGTVDEGVTTTFYADTDQDTYGDAAATIQACTAPAGYVADQTDCDDTDGAEHPGVTWYADGDGDFYGNPASASACSRLNSSDVLDGTDCDDADPDEHPGVTWYADGDGDSYGDPSRSAVCARAAASDVLDNTDCNDTVAAVHPGAAETCNGIDDDCDGTTDEGVTTTFYRDADGDSFGNPDLTEEGCSPSPGFVADQTDCDDADATEHPGVVWHADADGDSYGNPLSSAVCARSAATDVLDDTDCNDAVAAIHPGAAETCNGIDDDCNGSTDEGVTPTWYRDADGDTFGDPATSQQACAAPAGYVADSTDCDDNDPAEHPGVTWYPDADGDLFGNPASSSTCARAGSSDVTVSGDCNDAVATVNPGAAETCNGVDDDCDGSTDEGLTTVYYQDGDGDGYGNAAISENACTQPLGYVANSLDCNDGNGAINPGAPEVCNATDDDCDGAVDENVTATFYRDADGDTFGNQADSTAACAAPEGFVSNHTDCDDSRAAVNPAAAEVCGNAIDDNCNGQADENILTWYQDADHDSYGNGAVSQQACTAPAGYAGNSADCDDSNAAINPGATEVCDGTDNDCDGATDEGVLITYFGDGDGDGFGIPGVTTQGCSLPAGYAATSDDCNDADGAINPGAPELCDGSDNNCDGQVDENMPVWYQDGDGDSYGNPAVTRKACLQPEGYVASNADCNDGDPAIHPAAAETCNGIDEDCDGAIDENVKTTFYRDADEDGFGNPADSTQACAAPAGYLTDYSDCNDAEPAINPSAAEVCGNAVDENCDGRNDENIVTWYRDADGDGFGDPSAATTACTQPAGYVDNSLDCGDADAGIKPAGTEICDGIDNNCNGSIDEGVKPTFYRDRDGDTYGNPAEITTACTAPVGYVSDNTDCNDTSDAIHRGAAELCGDGIDNNCNDQIDENMLTWHQDLDQDGYGNASVVTQACTQPAGYVSDATDCDDNDAAEHPGVIWYVDADGDAYGTASSFRTCARASASDVTNNTDCNDADAAINPGAAESCDGIDNDCNPGTADGGWDSDKDGLGNSCDNCPYVVNLDQADGEGDGVGDACDNCLAVANSDQADDDGDSKGNSCDACPRDRDNDADGDTVCGDLDNCPAMANSEQANRDGDLLGDACDACPLDAENDKDGDGVCGDVDGCPADPAKSVAGVCGCGIPETEVCPGENIQLAKAKIRLLFGLVKKGGSVPVQTTSVPQPPPNFQLLAGSSYDIGFTGEFTGSATVCIDYNEAEVGQFENQLKMFHHSGGWVDITTSLDTAANRICGVTTSFSPFAVSEPLDTDGDGVPDTVDNCPTAANADQVNADDDSLGDACDACPLDRYNDADGDGACGNIDNCPTAANADQLDGDGDGRGDACDACPADAENDKDRDGVCGDVDGCPADGLKSAPGVCGCGVADVDSDGDGLLDCNDACPLDAGNDQDGDGICGNVDNCPEVANPDQLDSDRDGNGNSCDICEAGADDDTDGDGFADPCDPCPRDPDNDLDGDKVCGDKDGCPEDPAKTKPGICGCGVPDSSADTDGDKVYDCLDAYPHNPYAWEKMRPVPVGNGLWGALALLAGLLLIRRRSGA